MVSYFLFKMPGISEIKQIELRYLSIQTNSSRIDYFFQPISEICFIH